MKQIKFLLVLLLLALPFSLAQGQYEFEMLYWFGSAGGYPGEKGVKIPVFYEANQEVEAFNFELEVDSTKLSFADTAAIKGALIDSICSNPFLWEVDVQGNHLYVGCVLSMTGGITLPAQSEEVPLFEVILDVNPDLIPPDSTILDIKDVGWWPVSWYHGIDGTFYIHKEGCREQPGYSQPRQFELGQNYPNPFNPTTIINYELRIKNSPLHTTLKVYNILGQVVRTLVDEELKPGRYSVVWDGKSDNGMDVASGIYFYQLKAGRFSQTRKMVLLR